MLRAWHDTRQWLPLGKLHLRTSRLRAHACLREPLPQGRLLKELSNFPGYRGFSTAVSVLREERRHFLVSMAPCSALLLPPGHCHSSVPILISPSLLPGHQLYPEECDFQTGRWNDSHTNQKWPRVKDLFNSLMKGPARWQSWRGGRLKSSLCCLSAAVRMLGKISC